MSLAPPNLPSPAPTPEQHPQNNHPPQSQQSQDVIRAEVEQRLLRLSQDLYELEICAGDVVAGQEDRVPLFLQNINEHLVVLSDLSRRMTDSVPRQVVENVDQFKNPHQYTKNALSRATGENQYALGRILGLESFRRQLGDALSKDFPTVELPPRKHQPVRPITEGNGDIDIVHSADGEANSTAGASNPISGAGEAAQAREDGAYNGQTVKREVDGLDTVREEGDNHFERQEQQQQQEQNHQVNGGLQ